MRRPHFERDSVAIYLWSFAFAVPVSLATSLLVVRMHEAGVPLSEIGVLGFLGLLYFLKPAAVPLMERFRVPLWRRLGIYRAHAFWAMSAAGVSTAALGLVDVRDEIGAAYAFAVAASVSAIVIDAALHAHRVLITTKANRDRLVSSSQTGLRTSFLLSSALGILISDLSTLPCDAWSFAYLVFSVVILVGVPGVLLISRGEPAAAETVPIPTWREDLRRQTEGMLAVRNALPGALSALLLLICFYRASNLTSEFLKNPLYLDVGFLKPQIAGVAMLYGGLVKILAAATSWIVLKRFGLAHTLVAMTVLQVAEALLSLWVLADPSAPVLWTVETVSSWVGGLSIVVFFCFITAVVDRRYGALQFVCLSSLGMLLPKLLVIFGTHLAESYGYGVYFLYSAAVGVPAVWAALRIRSELAERSSAE